MGTAHPSLVELMKKEITMSLDLAVITDKKLSKEQLKALSEFLKANGFRKDRYGYHAIQENITLDLFIDFRPEKNEFWTDEPPKVVWFTPLAEITLESRHTRQSHQMSYRIAKKLAKLVGGFIYDNQFGTVYYPNGRPCDHFKTGEKFEKYGAGTDLFMKSVNLLESILNQ